MKVTVNSENESFDAELKFKRKVARFGNSAHLILPKDFVGREVVLFILKKVLHI